MSKRDVVFPPGPGPLRAQPLLARDSFGRILVRLRTSWQPRRRLARAGPRRAGPSAFENLNAILAAAGCTFDDVVDATVFIVDPEENFTMALEAMQPYWGSAPHPTLTGVGVTWLYGFKFELKVVAKLPE